MFIAICFWEDNQIFFYEPFHCSYIYGTVVEEDDPTVKRTMFAEFQQLLETLKNINRWVGFTVSML